jgi:hypothetical protein
MKLRNTNNILNLNMDLIKIVFTYTYNIMYRVNNDRWWIKSLKELSYEKNKTIITVILNILIIL